MKNFKEKSDKIWEVANLLRGDYKRSDYGKVILPLTVLRRLDCVLKPTKQKVLDYLPKVEKLKESAKDIALCPINLPPLSEQKAIAKILTAFDDKIELLQAQNKTLNKPEILYCPN